MEKQWLEKINSENGHYQYSGHNRCIYTEKKFWITTAHHELRQQIFYVNIVTANAIDSKRIDNYNKNN